MASSSSIKHRGFTMVELLVVISVLTVMLSLLIPSVMSSRNFASRVSCAANLRAIGRAMRAYSIHYAGHYPPPGDFGNPFAYQVGSYNSSTHQYAPAGLGLLYTSGVLKTTAAFYCTQPSYCGPEAAAEGGYLPSLVSQGKPIDWYQVVYGYCYYLQPGNTPGYGGQDSDPSQIQFATSPIASGNTILAGDITLKMFNKSYLYTTSPGAPVSNHITSGVSPDGGNELYNDGSVRWHNLAQLSAGYTWMENYDFYQ
jgi:prepilin-type N-terminal cleavage/methylation domain-containing protein